MKPREGRADTAILKYTRIERVTFDDSMEDITASIGRTSFGSGSRGFL